jgi:hypothetical protein
MRKLLLAAVAVTALGWAGGAMAQSHQGGYLGQNPGGQQTAAAPRPADVGSRQGGYLGLNPGANLAPAKAPEGDMRSSPTAWCATSLEPSRCRGAAAVDNHRMCLEASNYDACRFAFDRMYFK